MREKSGDENDTSTFDSFGAAFEADQDVLPPRTPFNFVTKTLDFYIYSNIFNFEHVFCFQTFEKIMTYLNFGLNLACFVILKTFIKLGVS